MIIDDDIRHLKEYRFQDGEFRHVRLEGDKLLEFIEWGFDLARQWGVRLWGVNSTFDKQSYRGFQPFSTLSHVSASWHGYSGRGELSAAIPHQAGQTAGR